MATAAPANRLWLYLIRQESVQEIFIRAIFSKRRSVASSLENQTALDNLKGSSEDKGSDSGTMSLPEPVRIIHKEQDSISAFCLNQVNFYFVKQNEKRKYLKSTVDNCNFNFPQVNPGLMALATPREVQEMDISLLLELPSWLEDECEFDLMNLKQDTDVPSSFLVVQVNG